MTHARLKVNNPSPTWRRCLRGIFVTVVFTVLVACGGGGGASSDSSSPIQTIQGTIASGVTVVPEIEAAATTLTLDATQGDTLVVTNPTGVLANAQTGQIVALPANDAQGIPFGLTTKVLKNADGSVSLQPAALEDVFTTLNIDFDSVRDGATIAGLISPKGGSMTLSHAMPNTLQSGLEYSACQLGLQAVVNIKCKNGALEGSIGFSQKVNVKKKGSTETASATIYGTVDISKLAAKVKVDFDFKKYPGTGGFNQAMVKLTGQFGAKVGIKVDDASVVELPSWSELIRSDGANIWDKNTKVKFSKYFELSGLNGDDKKGLIPLGGFYLTPVGTLAPFGGELSAGQLGAIKAGAVVVWIYIDMAGKLTLSGDLSVFKFNGAYVEKGFDITRVDGALQTRTFDVATLSDAYLPYFEGSAEVTQDVGVALAADLLVGGIRPFTVKAELLGGKATVKFDGKGGYRLWPAPSAWDGSLCANMELEAYSDVVLKSAIKAKLEVNTGIEWLSVAGSTGYERTLGPYKKVWGGTNGAGCFNTFLLPLTAKVVGQDSADPSKRTVEINFVDAFNNSLLRDQTGTWRLYIEGPSAATQQDIDSSYGGVYRLALPSGPYQFTVKALHKDLKDSMDVPIVIKASDKVALTISDLPIVGFSAGLSQGDCTALVLTSSSSAGAGAALTDYKWVVTPGGSGAMTQHGASTVVAFFSLPACGSVNVSHTVTDSLGGSTTVVKTINTTDMAPSVSSINPTLATANVPLTFTVVAQNLPLTAVMSIEEATCLTPTNRTTTGFNVVCTMGSTAGSKIATIKTDLQANGGTVIDAATTITVTAVAASNLLLGATVTDSCTFCADYSRYGYPNSLTDGNITSGRNIGTYSGSFTFALATPADIGRISLLPSMSPNGAVTFEVQTSTDANGAAGTWTSHGSQLTQAWKSGEWVDIALNANTTSVRMVKLFVYSSPSWVSFTEVQGYSATTSSYQGTFLVSANKIPGATFQVPSSNISCSFNSTGYWSWTTNTSYPLLTADGQIGTAAGAGRGLPLPGAPFASLVLKRSSTGLWSFAGSTVQVEVSGGEKIDFMMNDATDSGYIDGNTGSLIVTYNCH